MFSVEKCLFLLTGGQIKHIMNNDRWSLEDGMNKKLEIRESAKTLFLEKGIEKTSVREITERAHVAKGTFYLYYKDKQALVESLIQYYIAYISNSAFLSAVGDYEHDTWLHRYFDAVIDICETQSDVLSFIEKNLGSPIIKESIMNGHLYDERIKNNAVIDRLVLEGFDRQDAMIRMILGMHFTLSSCYNAIVFKQPAPMKILRPYILETVDKMFKGGKIDGDL